MTKRITLLLLCVAVSLPLFAESKMAKRIADSTAVMQATAKDIPPSISSKAVCVLIYPSVKKVGVGLGVTYGRGVLECRTGAQMNGKWSAPAMYTLDVGSLGAQLGSSSTDYVLVVLTQTGANKVLSGKLKLGADANATAGPSGANASGFNDTNIDIVTYSRAKGGLFAGVSLGSASMASDDTANKDLYGKDVNASQIINGEVPTPASGQPLVNFLDTTWPTRK